MAFTVPNQTGSIEDPTGVYPQAQLDSVDLQILAAGVGGANGVSSGCAVTAQGSPNNTVAVASGTVVVNYVEVAVSSGNVTMTAAHATLARFDLITVTNAGVKTYTAGTAATTPVFPAIPANSVVIASVYVDANDNVINSNQIIDKRVIVPVPTSIGSWTTVSKAADESKTSNTTLANDTVLSFALAASTKYRIRIRLFIATAGGTPDFKARLVGPSPFLYYMHWRSPVFTSGLESLGAVETNYSAADFVIAGTGAFNAVLYIDGYVQNSTTAGTFAIQWAQNVSDAAATTVRAGSYIDYGVA